MEPVSGVGGGVRQCTLWIARDRTSRCTNTGWGGSVSHDPFFGDGKDQISTLRSESSIAARYVPSGARRTDATALDVRLRGAGTDYGWCTHVCAGGGERKNSRISPVLAPTTNNVRKASSAVMVVLVVLAGRVREEWGVQRRTRLDPGDCERHTDTRLSLLANKSTVEDSGSGWLRATARTGSCVFGAVDGLGPAGKGNAVCRVPSASSKICTSPTPTDAMMSSATVVRPARRNASAANVWPARAARASRGTDKSTEPKRVPASARVAAPRWPGNEAGVPDAVATIAMDCRFDLQVEQHRVGGRGGAGGGAGSPVINH